MYIIASAFVSDLFSNSIYFNLLEFQSKLHILLPWFYVWGEPNSGSFHIHTLVFHVYRRLTCLDLFFLFFFLLPLLRSSHLSVPVILKLTTFELKVRNIYYPSNFLFVTNAWTLNAIFELSKCYSGIQ